MKNEEWRMKNGCANRRQSRARAMLTWNQPFFILHSTFIFLLLFIVFFFIVFMEETNKAMISLQSLAILSNWVSDKYPVSFRRFSQLIVSLASFNAMDSFEAKSWGLWANSDSWTLAEIEVPERNIWLYIEASRQSLSDKCRNIFTILTAKS